MFKRVTDTARVNGKHTIATKSIFVVNIQRGVTNNIRKFSIESSHYRYTYYSWKTDSLTVLLFFDKRILYWAQNEFVIQRQIGFDLISRSLTFGTNYYHYEWQ